MFKKSGEITPVRDLFEKYRKNLKAPQKTVELEAVRVIGELLNLKIKEELVSYTPSSRTLVLHVPSLLKQEIKLRQNEVLSELKSRLGDKGCPTTLL
jgi:hypothetical protein